MASAWWSSFKARLQSALGMRPTDSAAEKHFRADKPNWAGFDQNLERKSFRKAVLADPRADSKLKKFVATRAKIRQHSGPEAKVMSSTGKGGYSVQRHRDGTYTCTCPDFKYRRTFDGKPCKHIKGVASSGGLKTAAPVDPATPEMRQWLQGVQRQGRKRGYNLFLVAEDKSGHGGSIHWGANRQPGSAVHTARQSQMGWEAKRGIDPHEDFSGIKTSSIQSFGAEYAAILDQDPYYRHAADSAHIRRLRRLREYGLEDDDMVGTRLRTTEDDPIALSVTNYGGSNNPAQSTIQKEEEE